MVVVVTLGLRVRDQLDLPKLKRYDSREYGDMQIELLKAEELEPQVDADERG